MQKFSYTTEGYKLAVEYLKEIGELDKAKRGFSNDGWSIIMFANDVWNRNNKQQDVDDAEV